MAVNQVFRDVESRRFVAEVGSEVAPGTPLILGGTPVATITGSGDYSANELAVTHKGTRIVIAGSGGGIGLQPTQATVSPTGGYAWDVDGADADSITQGVTEVYMDSSGDLTLTSSGNTRFGKALFFRGELSATDTVVQIGE